MTSHRSVERLARFGRRVVALALALLVLATIGTVLLARVVPATGRNVFVVAGTSMEPALSRGSAVVTEPVPEADLRAGDVVSMRVGPQLAIFTHRIVRLAPRPDGLWLETKGDANEASDPSLVPASVVIGRVAATIPAVGFAIAALSTPSGVGAMFGITGVLYALLMGLGGIERSSRRRAALAPGWEVPRGATEPA